MSYVELKRYQPMLNSQLIIHRKKIQDMDTRKVVIVYNRETQRVYGGHTMFTIGTSTIEDSYKKMKSLLQGCLEAYAENIAASFEHEKRRGENEVLFLPMTFYSWLYSFLGKCSEEEKQIEIRSLFLVLARQSGYEEDRAVKFFDEQNHSTVVDNYNLAIFVLERLNESNRR